MNCVTARRAIALGTEAMTGDSRAAAAHAAECEGCRAFAAASVPPLTSFRDEHPLGDADLTRIRAQVKAAVREPSARPLFAPAFGFTALAAIVIGLFGYFLWQRAAAEPEMRTITTATFAEGVNTNRVSNVDTAPAATAPSTTIADDALDSPQPSPQPSLPTHVIASQREVPRVPAGAASVRRQPSDSHPIVDPPAVAAVAPAPLFIEIHTADPDVRILWIANQAPAEPNPTSVMED